MIYDRVTKETITEKVYKDSATRFLYGTTLGGLCLLFLRLPFVNRVYGSLQKKSRSKRKIDIFVEKYGVDMGGYESEFSSFNDFIIRKRAQPDIDAGVLHLIAPADSCLLAYTVKSGDILTVKDKRYSLAGFLKDEELARVYEDGVFLIFRLRVYDYHRFCFIDDGVVVSQRRIRGFLDSVNSAATGRFTLSSNCRKLSVLRTEHFDDVVAAEIGAMLVGRIVQTHAAERFCRGEEKGYFEFGGSSIVLLLKKGIVRIDDDILACSAKGVETRVGMGERIGKRIV